MDARVPAAVPDPDWYLDNVLIHAEPGRGGRLQIGQAARWQGWWRSRVATSGPLGVACEQGFVLATKDLRALGVSRSSTETAVRRGRWCSVARGVVAPLAVTDADQFAVAKRRHALLAAGTWLHRRDRTVAGRSGAILHGLPVRGLPARPALIAATRDGLGPGDAGHYFGAALTPDEVTAWFGVPVTTVARTLVDLARHDRDDAIMAADAALGERLVSRREISRSLERAAGWPGVQQARAVLALADARAESPLESLLRLRMHDVGFPPPELQYEIGGFRVDFCWPALRLIVEADGRGKYGEGELWREKKRETALRRLRWRVERVIWDDVLSGWSETALLLAEALGL